MSSAVLDASALPAVLQREPGSEPVAQALAGGASMSTVNVSEVVAKLADLGMAEPTIRMAIDALGISMVEFDTDLAYSAGLLCPATKQAGLSFGDRACLALARRMDVEALTTDRTWAALELDVAIRVVR